MASAPLLRLAVAALLLVAVSAPAQSTHAIASPADPPEDPHDRPIATSPMLFITWANLQFPSVINHVISVDDSTDQIFGQVYIDGATGTQGTVVDGVTAQMGYGPPGTHPSSSEWVWFDMRPNPAYDISANNDEYVGRMLPLRTGTFKFTTRWSTDDGATWVYTDQFGPPYDEPDAGDMTITSCDDTPPPGSPTDLSVDDVSSASVTLGWQPVPDVDGDGTQLVERPWPDGTTRS